MIGKRNDLVGHKIPSKLYRPTYNSWNQMRQRCFNKNCHAYERYGGIDIKPCKFIEQSALNLIEVLGFKNEEQNTLDRIDGNLGYHCGRCEECKLNGWTLNIRWATAAEQNRNRYVCNDYEAFGKTQKLWEWATEFKIERKTLWLRIQSMTLEEALLKPLRKKRIKLTNKEKSEALEMIKSGVSQNKVGEYFNVTQSYISRHIKF